MKWLRENTSKQRRQTAPVTVTWKDGDGVINNPSQYRDDGWWSM
jgi:hypothetical protein